MLPTVGGAVLALHTSGDRPKGESNKEYMIGFWLTVGDLCSVRVRFAFTELTYEKSMQKIGVRSSEGFRFVLHHFSHRRYAD